ncbi:class I SAM-dependent methyltransferase [soil metagenome]
MMIKSSKLTAPEDCKVFTPVALANAMAGVLADGPAMRWLEPCVGKGVFLDALANAGVERNRITAVELDHHDISAKCGEYHPGTDFLGWSLETNARFDRIIGNPPFLKLHRAHEAVIQAALRVKQPDGRAVPLKSNCWYAFLCACLRLLNPGGGLCLILPAGWEYADYANDLRQRLPRLFERFEIVRGAMPFFPGILDGCIVLIAKGFGHDHNASCRIEFPTLDEVVNYLESPNASPAVRREPNHNSSIAFKNSKLVPFGNIARVRIGAVSGDAPYFLMSETRRVELGISTLYARPVLTRARHLKGPEITDVQWASLREQDERVWLFWPRTRRGIRPKAIVNYLAAGVAKKVHEGYKTGNREKWFLTPMNPPADGFMSGMTSHGPWLCLNRADDLTATNTLYTVHFHLPLRRREKAAWAIALVCSTTADQHESVGRSYSKGLLKFEPQDVMDLCVPTPVDMTEIAVTVYRDVVRRLLEGDVCGAREAAELFVVHGEVPND